MRHAPAGIGRTCSATSVAPIQVVLHRPDNLLRDDVFLAAAQHLLMPYRNFQSHTCGEGACPRSAAKQS